MKLVNKEIKLAICDLDGTLIDSTGIWHQIDKEFFARRGMEVPPDYFKEICHLGLKGCAKFTKEKYGIKETEEEMLQEWTDASIHYYHDVIQLKPHAKDFLDYLKENNVIIALATANDESLYRPCLERLGIMKYFSFVTDVNIAKAGKESPDIYDSVCRKFNIPRENTIVLEDILVGIKTAHDNGFVTIGIDDEASASSREAKIENSHIYVYDLIELIK